MKIIWVLALLLVLSNGCCDKDKEEDIVMPPETSIGANTFGCYVNDDLFVTPKMVLSLAREAYYSPGTGYLNIHSIDFKDRGIGFDAIIELGKTHGKIGMAGFRDGDNYFEKVDGCEGEVTLTKLDLENMIVSGRFSFRARQLDLYSREDLDSIVTVCCGRFDLELEPINY